MQTTEYIAYQLLADPASKAYLEKYDIYIVPIVNPDGECNEKFPQIDH